MHTHPHVRTHARATIEHGAPIPVEAVTAGLVLTGQVHADPHEGNIMLADDGRLVFLDFGLMSSVDETVMEVRTRWRKRGRWSVRGRAYVRLLLEPVPLCAYILASCIQADR